MGTVRKILQNIILPQDDKLKSHWGLFFRGERSIIQDDSLILFKQKRVDFATYLNGFPLNKWRKYTKLKNVKLHIEIEGSFEFYTLGYHLTNLVLHEQFSSKYYNFNKRTTLEFLYPDDNEEEMLTFELYAIEDCIFYGGYFTAEFEQEDVREIELALATTTCKKEDFITKNIRLIKENIIESNDEIASHFNLHIIDNGRTLDSKELTSDRITVYPNKNVGGAGGFARGMIEAMRQEPKATNVLLMDDDVLVLPESIKRTYTLLTVLREEFHDSFISGAMLEYEEMFTQHEDIGFVNCDGAIISLKGRQNQVHLQSILYTNKDYFSNKNNISAWWYCCIPVDIIEKHKLPLPIFIRGDDMEYSLRCTADIISMTGICIWHMAFASRYSPSLLVYQQFRNLLLMQSISGVLPDVDLFKRIKQVYRQMILEFSYNSAELALDVIEDYLKGVEFISKDVGEEIFIKNAKYSEKLIPLVEFQSKYEKVDFNIDFVHQNPPINNIKRMLYKVTYNGHILYPQQLLIQIPATICYDMSYQPNKQALRKHLIATNTVNSTACLRTIDKKRFKELQSRYKKLIVIYKKNHTKIEKDYKNSKEYLTSQEFWLKYLEIN